MHPSNPAILLRPNKAIVAATPFSLTFTDNAQDNTGQTTYNWSSRNFAIGTADTSRRLGIVVCSRGGTSTPTADSLLVNGSATGVTKVCEGRNVVASTSVDVTTLWEAVTPSGTTATISATFSSAMVRAGCAVFSILGSNGVTPSGGAIASDSTNANSTGSITVPSGGSAIVAGCCNTNAGISNATPTNWTADTATTPAILIGSTLQYVVGHDANTGARTYTITWSSASAPQSAGAFAAWGP